MTSISGSSRRTKNVTLSTEVQDYAEHKPVALSNFDCDNIWRKPVQIISFRACLPGNITSGSLTGVWEALLETQHARVLHEKDVDLILRVHAGTYGFQGLKVYTEYTKNVLVLPLSLGSSLTAIGAICRSSSIIPTHHGLQQWFLPRNKPCLLPHPSNWFNRWQEEQFIYGNYICVLGL